MTALALKLIACLCMLLDHIGYLTWNDPLRAVGRLALPIFAFQLTEGFSHTRHMGRYLLRLGVFAAVSEVPFDLCFHGVFVYPRSQNVFFTLFLALACLWAIRWLEQKKTPGVLQLAPVALACVLAEALKTDYGMWGVLLTLVFYYAKKLPRPKLAMAAGLLAVTLAPIALDEFFGAGATSWQVTQLARLVALVPIFLYDGRYAGTFVQKRPELKKMLQYGVYLFYPLHLVALSFIFVL